MFPDIAEAPKPVAPAISMVDSLKLETVPEDVKTATGRGGPSKAPAVSGQQIDGAAPVASKEFPTKTDKPRPHVCLTCKRSFARLEHLKRHERSHTKEKPFECPECTRCFARRDLLLRHQQKLHMTTTPSSRPRAGRRESASSSISAAGKIRKNSAVHPNSSMRPRANTISNIGNPALEMFAGAGGGGPGGIHSPQPTVVFGRMLSDAPQHLRPHIVPGHHGVPTGLPKLNTSIANGDMSGGMRTAPIFSDPNFSMDTFFSPDSTVNPAALHFPEGPHTAGLDSPSPFQEVPGGMPMGHLSMDLAGGMDWMNDFGTDLSLINTNDSQVIAGSSPSVIDTDSPGDASEYALDRKSSMPQHTAQWQGPVLFAKGAAATLPEYMMGMGLDPFPQGPPSPGMMADFPAEGHLPPNPQFQLHNPLNPISTVHGMMPHPHHHQLQQQQQQQQQQQHQHHHHHQHHHQFSMPIHGGESPSTMASTTDTSVRQGSIGAGLAITIPESTRNAMMITLAQPSTFGSRKYSQPTISSPLSPGFAAKAQQAVNMPSTAEFQRFIVAYVKFFHPHMPFFHIPTLSFDIPFSSGQQGGRSNSPVFGIANSGGCLILAMSAIGALYEGEVEISKTLFNFSKRMLSIFLEERRKADISSAFGSAKDSGAPCPPVWLVQAMLLNVIYGHMCGDKTAEINAHTHGAALVGLARGANLTEPAKKTTSTSNTNSAGPGGSPSDAQGEGWNPRGEDPAWYEWHVAEEKKRTLYAVFNVSSMLTSAYNHSPALRNGEITLDLPCDEDLWAAESAEAWYSLGGSMAVEQNSVPFNLALNNLLTAYTRQPIPMYQMSQTFCKPNGGPSMSPEWPRAEFHASTFGCVVLINALHNYIWETRQRHGGRQWTASETEDMHRQIEPALVAWQAVWSAIPHHSVERPNPFGMGPLAADSIPLLDLAYLVMYVNPGKSKECFWNRDFEGMSQEIASGYELVQHAEQESAGVAGGAAAAAAATTAGSGDANGVSGANGQGPDVSKQRRDDASQQRDVESQARKATRRERHLRKAAMHAANSLVLSGRNNTTFADFTSRELPIQAALCTFTCSQVLAEWVATVQERVGPYLGIFGVDHIDLQNVPAMVLLEEEDITLFKQIVEILATGEAKMHNNAASQNGTFQPTEKVPGMGEGEAGYAARLLHVMGGMLDSASVWPVTQLMNQGLEVQARFMKDRAERSRLHSD